MESEGWESKKKVFCQTQQYFGSPGFFLACLYPCVWCSVSLTRGVPGLRRGQWKMRFSCFATKALLHVTEETPPNGGGLGWIIQRLQSISSASPHLDTSLDHRVCRLIMGMLTIPCAMYAQAPWQHERLWQHGFLWVCNLAKLTVELLNSQQAILS